MWIFRKIHWNDTYSRAVQSCLKYGCSVKVHLVRCCFEKNTLGSLSAESILVNSTLAWKYTATNALPRRYSREISALWSLWRNSWVLVYKLSRCGFESRSESLKFQISMSSLFRESMSSLTFRQLQNIDSL